MINLLHCKQQGPHGGQGGNEFAISADGRITALSIRCGGWIDAVQLLFQKQDGTEDSTEKAGGNGGGLKLFRLSEGERITKVYGGASQFVDLIVIETDKGRKETFGNSSSPVNFTYIVEEGHQLVGFFGRAATYVDALGILTIPEPTLSGNDKDASFNFLEGLA